MDKKTIAQDGPIDELSSGVYNSQIVNNKKHCMVSYLETKYKKENHAHYSKLCIVENLMELLRKRNIPPF